MQCQKGILIRNNNDFLIITVAHGIECNYEKKIYTTINKEIFYCSVLCIEYIFDICILKINNEIKNNINVKNIKNNNDIKYLFEIEFPKKNENVYLINEYGRSTLGKVNEYKKFKFSNFPKIEIESKNDVREGDSGLIIINEKFKIIGIQIQMNTQNNKKYYISPSIYIFRILREYLLHRKYHGLCNIFPILNYSNNHLIVKNTLNLNYNIQPEKKENLSRRHLKVNDVIEQIDNNKIKLNNENLFLIKYDEINFHLDINCYLSLKCCMNETFTLGYFNLENKSNTKSYIKKKQINCRPIHSILNIKIIH